MLNNKGQVLIIFVLIIPLILLGAAYIVDNSLILYNSNRLNQINKVVIKEISTNDINEEEIYEYYKKNDSDIVVDSIYIDNMKVEISIYKEISSLFGTIIGKDTYIIKSTLKRDREMPIEKIEQTEDV